MHPWPPRSASRPADGAVGRALGPSPQVTPPPWPSRQAGKMGHPADAHSTPAPAGTTAGPGLVPDLVARTPWPHWALAAVTLAAGVLVASCILCAICRCCHRRRRREGAREKEAVGLGRAHSTTTPCPVQPDVDTLGCGPGEPQQWGRLQLALEYDRGSQEIRVRLKQAADLKAAGTADPYARVSVSTQPGRWHETKVHRGVLCPEFEETCCFLVPPAELPGATLQVQLLDFKRFSGHEPLGALSLALGTEDLQHVLERWFQLGPPGTAQPELLGELCVSLRYVPGAGRLCVAVLEARGLRPGPTELYVKVQLMLGQRRWKKRRTSARKGSASPYFNEAFTFLLPVSQVQSADLVLAVWARGPQLRAEPVGKVLLGAHASGQPLQHWADALAHARRPVAQWHRLQPAGEVDRTLAPQPRLRLPLPHS
ncbi:LOW QUALITY PROTEIN: synaptotagmin-8 [Microcebus murinus]|uniref:LOW QUALITY PROTEIN: synaptotagmin-8 n=1 Tax=Microcebus murinus TaxID=30608 RepID=UPI003F6B8EF4